MKTNNNRHKNIPFDPSTTPERPPNDPATTPDQPRQPDTPGHATMEAVSESGTAGEIACATTSTAVFPKVGQAVSPADFLTRRFLYRFIVAVSSLAPHLTNTHSYFIIK
jgi:hypothetical protein